MDEDKSEQAILKVQQTTTPVWCPAVKGNFILIIHIRKLV